MRLSVNISSFRPFNPLHLYFSNQNYFDWRYINQFSPLFKDTCTRRYVNLSCFYLFRHMFGPLYFVKREDKLTIACLFHVLPCLDPPPRGGGGCSPSPPAIFPLIPHPASILNLLYCQNSFFLQLYIILPYIYYLYIMASIYRVHLIVLNITNKISNRALIYNI